MPDVFDTVAETPDVFDQVEPDIFDAVAAEKEPPTLLERLYQPVVSFGTGAARSVAGTLETAGYLSHLTGNIDPEFAALDETMKRRELEQNPLYALGQRMRKRADEPEMRIVHPELTGTQKWGELTGQMAADLAGTGKISGVMKAAGIGATGRRLAAPAVQFGTQGGARGIESATEAQASEADLLKSFVAQAGIGGATSTLGPYGKWVERLNAATGGGFKKIIANAVVEGGGNAVQEVTEQLASAYADKQILEKDHDLYAELVESAKTGGVMGVAASLVISALGGKARSPSNVETPQTFDQSEAIPVSDTPALPLRAPPTIPADLQTPSVPFRNPESSQTEPSEFDFINQEIARRKLAQGDSAGARPLSGRDAEGVQAPSEGSTRTALVVSDLVNKHPGIVEGFDTLDVEGQELVLSDVLAALHDDQVVRGIVQSVPVDVVNMLVGPELTAQDALHDGAVLRNALAVHARNFLVTPEPVSRFLNALTSLAPAGATRGAVGRNLTTSDEVASTESARPSGIRAREGTSELEIASPRAEFVGPPASLGATAQVSPMADDASESGHKTILSNENALARRIQDEQQQTLFQRSVDERTGQRYALPNAVRKSSKPDTDLAKATALSRFAKLVEADQGLGRKSKRPQTRLQSVNWSAPSASIPEVRSAEAIAEANGKKVVWFKAETPVPYNGGVTPGDPTHIFLNVDSVTDPVHQTVAHEVTHFMQREAPEIYGQYRDAVVAEAKRRGKYDANRIRRGYTEKELNDELVADLTAEAIENPARLQAILGDNPNLWQRVIGYIKDVIDRIERRFKGERFPPEATDAITDLRTAHRAMEKAFREWHSVRSQTSQASIGLEADRTSVLPQSERTQMDIRGRVFPASTQGQLRTEAVVERLPEAQRQQKLNLPQSQTKPSEPQLKRQELARPDVESKLRSMMPPKQEGMPVVDYNTNNPLPDFHEYAKSKIIFGQGWGAENIPVLGKLYGGRFNARDPITKAIATWHGEANGVGKAIASALGVEMGGKVNVPFRINKKGDLDIEAKPGQSKKAGDVFESLRKDPASYKLTPEQQAAWERMKPILERMTALKRQYGLIGAGPEFFGEDAEDSYFPRIVTKEPPRGGKEAESPRGGGGRVGAKQFFQKQRAFKTEAEGWAKGYEYETNIEARLVKSVERMYKAIADKRLAADPDLGAKTRRGLISELLDSYSEEVIDGRMTAEEVQRIADSKEAQGRVHQPAFMGKIFDRDVAKTLNNAFPGANGRIITAIVKGNNFAKGVALGFDLGVGQIQGIHLLLSSPIRPQNALIWAKAQVKGLQELVKPGTFSKYANQNKEVIREMAQMGSSVGQLQEMMQGVGRGELLTKIPVIGTAARRFGSHFQTFLDVAKVELYKSWRDVSVRWNSETKTMERDTRELPKLVQAIESMIGGARMESIGLGRARTITERALLLAPSYYRGGVNLMAGMAEKGVSGSVARNAMAGYLIGGAALFYGLGKALGMDDDELARRFSPMDRNFMKWRLRMADGKEVNLGIGGIHRSFIRLFGQIASTSKEHPENWKSLTASKNPIVSWLRSHSSPVVSFLWDNFTGEDFLGRPVDITRSYEPLTPIFLRPAVSKVEKVPGTFTEYVSSFFGVSGYGLTPEDQVKRLANEFKREIGIPPKARGSYPESEYRNLEWALRNADQQRIKKEHALLLKNMEGVPHKKPARVRIFEHFKLRGEYTFTGSKEREAKFLASLTPEQKQLYQIAMKENRALAARLREALAQ